MGDRWVNPRSNMLGLLRIRIKRGINLAIRDVNSSDPYVIVRHGKQKLKTRVVKKTVNPEWNEDLTLCVMDLNEPVKLDLNLEGSNLFSIQGNCGLDGLGLSWTIWHPLPMGLLSPTRWAVDYPDGTVIKKVKPSRENCVAEESFIVWSKGNLTQDMFLRLKNVESGEIELSLTYIDIPGSMVA
ncbi:hypothetical protein Cgig2_012391 [Carnegiea gigantea]|uniref:C2 domain-containing protein n=1 Tax=Carnegiea gigantea TaxID=171969 RepID=A0A9Q1GYZ3_9CARY|nr:hypothetical protein Cgig2_012391 [Carnegiea gigantea]